ncbi:MAG: polysaccharide deacetylase family protein [Pelosinus sp.]|nr:polysaccharide deacetylase family protein [Pelosinus sp.]
MLNKSPVKKILIVACFLAAIIAAFFSLLSSPQGIPILNYHMVDDQTDSRLAVGTEEFAAQMAYLKSRGYTSITPDELMQHWKKGVPLPEKPVLITFDDGYKDNFTNAFPIMQQYGFTGTIFLITDYISNNEWYLNWEEIQAMQQRGFVFGSHTLSHTPLTTLSFAEAEKELREPREILEWRLTVPVTYLAYPTGAYNDSIRDLTKEVGYDAAFTVDFGRVFKGDDPYALRRIPIFKSKMPLVNFYLRLEMTPAAAMLHNIKEKFWPAPPEEEEL